MGRIGSPTIRATLWRGFNDAKGSWKTICICRRSGRRSPSLSLVMSLPRTRSGPVGLYRRRIARPDGRLPAAGLADQAERLAAVDLERHAVDGADVPDVAVEDDAALDREPDLEVLELDQRPRRAAHHRPRPWPRSARTIPAAWNPTSRPRAQARGPGAVCGKSGGRLFRAIYLSAAMPWQPSSALHLDRHGR